MPHQTAKIEWYDNGTPVSTQFDDPYFSPQGGLEETYHTFLAGNGLPDRFFDGFHIAELGFGSGLNMLAALKSFREAGQTGTLRFTSFEAFPMNLPDMARILAMFDGLDTDILTDQWTGEAVIITAPNLRAEIIMGDARTTLPVWGGTADAWFLDGFSPAKNPELWSSEILGEVGKQTASNGTFATYSAAGHVRASLTDAGFNVERVAGFGRKRYMSVGRKG
jgi:tRNA U34 5-methylaminomethyl-2-thiouridine-forming methyltransferase MnmC